jgi:hypothetical protein
VFQLRFDHSTGYDRLTIGVTRTLFEIYVNMPITRRLGKKASKYCSQEIIEEFKKRQELLKTIPEPIRIRTKEDESYREGWVDAAGWIQERMNEIFDKYERSGA